MMSSSFVADEKATFARRGGSGHIGLPSHASGGKGTTAVNVVTGTDSLFLMDNFSAESKCADIYRHLNIWCKTSHSCDKNMRASEYPYR